MQPHSVTLRPAVALIDEARCIGCTLCIQVCPVDAIVGAAKLMHTVIAGTCTGCELCLPPCPVDCISMLPTPLPDAAAWIAAEDAARRRVEARNARLLRDEKAVRAAAQREASAGRRKRETIAKALARAKLRLGRS